MAHHDSTSFKPCPLLDLLAENETNSSKANGVRTLLDHPLHNHVPAPRLCPFRYDHDTKSFSSLVPFSHLFRNDTYIVGDFRDKNDISSSRHPGIKGQPASSMPHPFNNHNSVMGLRRCVYPVDSFCGDRNGRIETKRDIRASEIVINRFWQTDDRQTPVFEKPVGDAKRSISSDAHQAGKIQVSQISNRSFRQISKFQPTPLLDCIPIRVCCF